MAKKLSFKDNLRVTSKLLKYIKRYVPLLILSLIFTFVAAVFSLYLPVLIGECVDIIAENGFSDVSVIVDKLIKMGVIILITGACQWLMNVLNNKMTVCIVRDIRRDAFTHIQKVPVSYVDTHPHGDVVSRIIADVDTFSDGLLMGFNQFFTGAVTILGTLAFMIRINLTLSLIVVLMTPISVFAAGFIASRIHRYFVSQSEIKGQVTSFIDENVTGVKVVKTFGKEQNAICEFEKINDELKDCSLKAVFFSSTVNPTTRFVNNAIYAVVALCGAYKVVSGTVTIGELTCMLSYANQYTKPFNEISGVITELQNALCCVQRIFELMEAPEYSENTGELASVQGNVDFKNVSFSYTKEKPLIQNFSLNVKKGMRVAIVGPTGCGKTTIINLLMKFYDIDSGAIVIDGMDTGLVSRKSLRENFGMVLQETFLFHGTVKENIAMVRPDATDDEIVTAARASYADSFIRRLPNGYDTYIGDDIGGLSEGQKQLLCIARVMLLLPPILILDEATSSIDTRTEMKIQRAFNKLMEGKTGFVVAHRLSTIKNSDIILVMKDGHIIEQGNHTELMKQKGFYYNLYTGQYGAGV